MTTLLTRRNAAAALLGLLPVAASAQGRFPSRQITIIAPFPPGASTDLVGRTIARRLSETFGTPVIVENRAGAGGVTGSEYTARQRPDGHTLQVALNATHGSVSLFNRNVPYDPFRDFTYIALFAGAPTGLVAHPSVEATDMAGLLAWARRNPGSLQCGSSGVGSHHHLAIELLRQQTGLPFVHVPFRGGGEALNAVIGGHIPLCFGTLSTFLPHAQEGRLRLIALMDSTRAEAAPQVAPIRETIPNWEIPSLRIGIVGPAGIPAPIVAQLHDAIAEAAANADVRAVLAAAGMQVSLLGPAEFRERFEQDFAAFKRIVDAAGIRPE